MTPARPLHVRVAEALGFRVRDASIECRGHCITVAVEDGSLPIIEGGTHRHGGWERWWPPTQDFDGEWEAIPDYATDWSAAGPLIDKYQLSLFQNYDTKLWSAGQWGEYGLRETPRYKTALIAVCEFVVALAFTVGSLRKENV